LSSNRGMPGLIPEVARPVTALPFFVQELRVPRGPGSNRTDRVPSGARTHQCVPWCFTKKALIWMMEKTATGEGKSVFADLTGKFQ